MVSEIETFPRFLQPWLMCHGCSYPILTFLPKLWYASVNPQQHLSKWWWSPKSFSFVALYNITLPHCVVCFCWSKSLRLNSHPSNISLQLRHNERDSVSNHQPHHCLLNRLFGCRSKKTSKLHVTGLCVGKWPVTRKMFPFDDVIMYFMVFPDIAHCSRDWLSITAWYAIFVALAILRIYCIGKHNKNGPWGGWKVANDKILIPLWKPRIYYLTIEETQSM